MEDQEVQEESSQVEDENEKEVVSVEKTIEVEHDIATETDKIIAEIMEVMKERKEIKQKNCQLQHRLSIHTQEAILQDKFNVTNLPPDANEEMFRKILLENIDSKQKEIDEYRQISNEKLESIQSEMHQKEDEWKQINEVFKSSKEKTALSSVNCEDGSQYVKEEVEELLQKEEKMRAILEQFQLEAIKTNYHLQSVTKQKKNLVEGFLDFGEYEIMCTNTENNNEVIKQLKDEIKDFTRKASKDVNSVSHLLQKFQDAQRLLGLRAEEEKLLEGELNEMKEELFKEKLKYTKMKEKNEDMHHRNILLQYPRLLDDYQNLKAENEEAQKEIEQLKEVYLHTKKLMS